MQPEFGTDIYATLFEPNTEIVRENLQQSLEDDIAFWLPYIQLNAIDVVGDIDNYTLSIRIRYKVQNSNAERVIIVLANENELLLSEIDGIPSRLAQVGLF
jgi:phage baseplate assembly protein W